MKKDMTRRNFVKSIAVGTAATYFTPALKAVSASAADSNSRVVIASHNQLIDSNEHINAKVVRTVVDEVLVGLTKTSSVHDAWAAIFPNLQSSDTIGIKVNCINRRQSSHPEVVYGLAESLSDSLGFNPNNIIIWDRTSRELKRAKYTINTADSGIRCLATSDGVGYDKRAAVQVGKGTQVHLSNILTKMCSYLINVPVLKDHGIAGLTLSMKNHYGSIDRPGACHGNSCDPYIANLNNTPQIKEKTKLILCDALFGIYQGGPMGSPQWINHQILASTDPVALDFSGMMLIDAKRQENKMSLVSKRAAYLHTATTLGLGTNDPAQIALFNMELG